MESKRLILIRHAHRDTENHSLDNGLSAKGKKQVQQMVAFALRRELEKAVFFSSPKKRCVETITPLVREFEAKVQIETAIGEGSPLSSVDRFLDRWKYEGSETTVLCSHGDVIPIIVEKLTGAHIALKKAGWCEIEMVGRDCYLTWLVQKYD